MSGLGQGHQGTKVIQFFFIIVLLMHLGRINACHIEINEKIPLFNLYSSSLPAVRRAGLRVFGSLWLNA